MRYSLSYLRISLAETIVPSIGALIIIRGAQEYFGEDLGKLIEDLWLTGVERMVELAMERNEGCSINK